MNSRQVPNLVTLSRLLLAVVAFWFLHRMIHAGAGADFAGAAFWAFWFYLAAAATDFLDGFLARRYGWLTPLGRVADPVVDKVLILGGMMFLAAAPALNGPGDFGEVMPVWAVVVVLAREFLVTALRGVVESRGLAFPADRYGKLKMVLQATYVLILIGAAGQVPQRIYLPFLMWLREPLLVALLFWLAMALTVLSGLNYTLRAARMLR